MVRFILGDVRKVLRKLKTGSVHCIITSPPYYGLRDYGVDRQIGLESSPDNFVHELVKVFRECRRVLRDDGTLFLNIGDSYSKKQRLGIPHLLAFALKSDGWYWRDEIVWHAPNKMPESTQDRCSKNHEFLFMLTKSPRYFYDQIAIREPAAKPFQARQGNPENDRRRSVGPMARGPDGVNPQHARDGRIWGQDENRTKRSVWTINVAAEKVGHFAAYPKKLVLPCLLAGTSEKGCCPKCGAPWVRKVKKIRRATRPGANTKLNARSIVNRAHHPLDVGNRDPQRHVTVVKTVGWKPDCDCGTKKTRPCVVLDPFGGTGTTAAVAVGKNRRAILVELNPEYMEFARAKVARAERQRGFGL